MGIINYEHKTWYDKSDSRAIPINYQNLNRIDSGISDVVTEINKMNMHWWKKTAPDKSEEYVMSAQRDAYPDDVDADSNTYEYLGIPMEKAANAVRLISGFYYGDGSSERFIDLGVTPKAVILYSEAFGFANKICDIYGGLMTTDSPSYLKIVENGFNVQYIDYNNTGYRDVFTNDTSSKYWYIALF